MHVEKADLSIQTEKNENLSSPEKCKKALMKKTEKPECVKSQHLNVSEDKIGIES